jgi:hypothetical protein
VYKVHNRQQPESGKMVICVFIFSKDRPFQLGQYLRTLFRYSGDVLLKVSVIANIQKEYEEGYKKIVDSFPQVLIVRETNFAEQLLQLIACVEDSDNVVFGVDDALFCAEIPWSHVVGALLNYPSIQCIHLKLCPGITFCHPAGSVQVRVS